MPSPTPGTYLMHIRSQSCSRCNHFERWSETFFISLEPLRGSIEYRSVCIISDHIPLVSINLPMRQVRCCSNCHHTLNLTAQFPTEQSWKQTLTRKQDPIPTHNQRLAAADQLVAAARQRRAWEHKIIATIDSL